MSQRIFGHQSAIHKEKYIHSIIDYSNQILSGIQNLLEQKITQGHRFYMQTPVFTVYVQATLKVNNLITLQLDLKSKWHQKGNKHGAFPGMAEDGRRIQHF